MPKSANLGILGFETAKTRAERKNLDVLAGAVVKSYGKGIVYSRSYAFVNPNRIPLGREEKGWGGPF